MSVQQESKHAASQQQQCSLTQVGCNAGSGSSSSGRARLVLALETADRGGDTETCGAAIAQLEGGAAGEPLALLRLLSVV